MPRHWSYLDGRYIKAVHGSFGNGVVRSLPNLCLHDIAYYTFVRGIRQVPFLNYFNYNKTEAKAELAEQFNWKDYGGHHYENIYSKFAFGWLLPNKFGIDKRKVSLSGPVRSGQMTRDAALEQLKTLPVISNELVQYVYQKLGLTSAQFDQIMALPLKSYKDYPTSESYLRYLRWPVKKMAERGLITPVLYEKYFG